MSDFARKARIRLVALAVGMAALYGLADPFGLSLEERALWERVRAAQQHLVDWRDARGSASPAEVDPAGCGMIGVEWSELTTTLGSLEAKRSACNPAWALQFLRWYRDVGLAPGDGVAIYSSASFPAMLLNAWMAADAAGLRPLVVVSLGASTWGANHPDAPWPVLEMALRRGGHLSRPADFYTLGGGGEVGGGLSPAALERLEEAARAAGVELLRSGRLEDMVDLKAALLDDHGSGLLVTIGGPHSSLGDDPAALRFPPGLNRPGDALPSGNGVAARALEAGIPVVHVLDLRALSRRVGLPFDATTRPRAPLGLSPAWALAGLGLFFTVLLTHRRWRLV